MFRNTRKTTIIPENPAKADVDLDILDLDMTADVDLV